MLKKFLILACTAAILLTASNSQAQANLNEKIQPCKFQVNGIWLDSCDAYVVNCKQWITLRNRASVYGDDLAHIPLGAQVTFYGDVGGTDFCEISYRGIKGYAMKYYIQVVEY